MYWLWVDYRRPVIFLPDQRHITKPTKSTSNRLGFFWSVCLSIFVGQVGRSAGRPTIRRLLVVGLLTTPPGGGVPTVMSGTVVLEYKAIKYYYPMSFFFIFFFIFNVYMQPYGYDRLLSNVSYTIKKNVCRSDTQSWIISAAVHLDLILVSSPSLPPVLSS